MHIEIRKSHIFAIIGVVALLFVVSSLADVNTYAPWHFLQQVAKGPYGAPDANRSIDENGDGIVDLSNNASYAFDSDRIDGKHAALTGADIVPHTKADGKLADSVLPAFASSTGAEGGMICVNSGGSGGPDIVGYAKYVDVNSQVTCYVPDQIISGGSIQMGDTLLWVTDAKTEGGISPLPDSMCSTDAANWPYLNTHCQNIHAFIATTKMDMDSTLHINEVRDLPDCDPDNDGIHLDYYNCGNSVHWYNKYWKETTYLADDWRQLLSGNYNKNSNTADSDQNEVGWTGTSTGGKLLYQPDGTTFPCEYGIDRSSWGTANSYKYGGYGSFSRIFESKNTFCNVQLKIFCACKYA